MSVSLDDLYSVWCVEGLNFGRLPNDEVKLILGSWNETRYPTTYLTSDKRRERNKYDERINGTLGRKSKNLCSRHDKEEVIEESTNRGKVEGPKSTLQCRKHSGRT